jgi:hypothetical protein
MNASFGHYLRQKLARVLTGLSSRISPEQAQAAQGSSTPNPAAGLPMLPPFAGGADEAALLWELPPVAVLYQKEIARIGPDGRIPGSAEVMKLTSCGKVLGKVEYLAADDFSELGDPARLIGRCAWCQRLSFRSQPCADCRRVTCPECGGSVPSPDGKAKEWLCGEDLKSRERNRDLWH